MRAVWENTYSKLIQAVYTEDSAFTLLYGPTRWQGVLNSLKMALAKVGLASKVYRIEDDDGVIVGFAIIDWQKGTIDEAHIRPAQKGKTQQFYTLINTLLATGSNYHSYVISNCAINSCAFIQATTTCNFLPVEFRVNGCVLEYKYTWSKAWIPLFDACSFTGGGGSAKPPKIILRKNGSWIEWSYEGTDVWYQLYNIEDYVEHWDSVRLPVTSNSQTVFDLATLGVTGPIDDVQDTNLYVNGQKRYYPQDYTIVGLVLTWVDTDYELETIDEVELHFKKLGP